MKTYLIALKKELHTVPHWVEDGTKHIKNIGFKGNQLVERLHSTQKERIKVMCGLTDFKSVENHTRDYRNYYNYIRPN